MQSPRTTRSTVLGKRAHQSQAEVATPTQFDSHCQTLPTPDPTPNPKRARVSIGITDGDSNKENIPPFTGEILSSSSTSTRSLRRTSTEATTPRSRNARRHASMSNLTATPASSFSDLSLATPPPSPPSVLLPLHVRARALLRPTCNSGTDIAGRSDERDVIQKFIASFLDPVPTGDRHSALYISGSPGTGKTALVNAVLHTLRSSFDENDVTVVSVNCMALNGLDAIWERIAEELEGTGVRKGKKIKKQEPIKLVESLLASRQSKCVIILDELDQVASNAQSLMSLFTLTQTYESHICVIGIANTHTLTSSSSTNLMLQSLKSVRTLHFAPYSPQHLLQILTSRLAPLSSVDSDDSANRAKTFLPVQTVTLLAKKIAAQTGDVRAAFEVLRGAIELAVQATTTADLLDSPSPIVTPSHVLSALKAYSPASSSAGTASSSLTSSSSSSGSRKPSDSEVVTKVRDLGLHARLVMLAMLLAHRRIEAGLTLSTSASISTSQSSLKRTSSSPNARTNSHKDANIDSAQLHAFYSAVLTRNDSALFSPVSRSEFGDLLGMIETVGLVVLSSGGGSLPGTPSKSGRRGFSRSSSFNVGGGKGSAQDVRFVEGIRMDEVSRGLGIMDTSVEGSSRIDVREEEVCAIWERERARICREVKASARSRDVEETFKDAMQA